MSSRINEFMKQYWIIFLLLPFSILFFLFGPKIIASLFIDEGKPIKEDIEINDIDDDGQYKYSIDSLTIFAEDIDIYKLSGWAFSTKYQDVPSSEYKTEIVLYNDSKNYLFSIEPEERKGVVETFQYLNQNIEMPGFSVLINNNHIDIGDYCLGILLTNEQKNSVQFIETIHVITNTPNTLLITKVQSLVCERNKPESKPLLENVSLKLFSNENRFSIDGISKIEDNKNIYHLYGWAFSTSKPNEPTDVFKTEIILFNRFQNYLFETKPVNREGVVRTFSDLGLDIRMPGLSAYIDKEAILSSNYCIAVKLTHLSTQETQFINTNKEIKVTDDEIFLIDDGNNDCEDNYLENMNQFSR